MGLALGDLVVVNRPWVKSLQEPLKKNSIILESYKLHETKTEVVLCPQDFPFLRDMPFLEPGPLQAAGMRESQMLSSCPGTWRDPGAPGAHPGASQCCPNPSYCSL